METVCVSQPFKMDGTHNFRDLGGYPVRGGKTRKGCFFRSDALTSLSEEDREWMIHQGITCVLDLRSRKEMEQTPDQLNDSFEYHSITMSDRMNDKEDRESGIPNRLSDLYIRILNTHQDKFKEIMETLIGRKGKPVVFHCAVGKDRTGVTAMLLLMLAGVPREVILQDYAVSAGNMKETFDKQKQLLKQAGWDVPYVLFESPKEEMERTISYLEKTWGSAEAYLKTCGITEDEVRILKEYLVEKKDK